ncbi:nucleotide-binding protein [Kordiimonas sediminis]|uniref:Nucleotide-binding protein n=1 Tax=Kordiimonas sediminis TaxID=1735581 RepID=A0A919E3R8_9PROT|nr:RNase adapter RapZ [Kordiimonas sediminis]GHF16646.1 nucleotide-binding protein [Kordiimonas sediminis]
MGDTVGQKSADKRNIVIVTGLSGAGKSAALNALEDIGYQTVDNLPLTMVGQLLAETGPDMQVGGKVRPLAIGLDSRTLYFSPQELRTIRDQLNADPDIALHVLFMDASTRILTARFSETRRRHPLARNQQLSSAIKQERELMAGLRPYVDGIIDTSDRTTADTKRLILGRFTADASARLIVTFMSFGFSKGVPRDADMVIDVRFLRNPHYTQDLRPLTGRDKRVANYVRADEGFEEFIEKLKNLMDFLLPRYIDEGKSYLTLAFGCTGGRHRSVMVAETMASHLSEDGMAINLFHRELPADERV